MATRHKTPNGPSARHPKPERRRSHGGRILGAVIAAGSTVGVGTGLSGITHRAPAVCGGTERWNVKVGNDADSKKVEPNAKLTTVADLNKIVPGPVDSGGRMEAEKKQYTINGYISYFAAEDDGDYHVVITDDQGGFSKGHSVVVEIPDPSCFRGKSGKGSANSQFAEEVGDARTLFEEETRD